MYVVVKHEVVDAEGFQRRGEAVLGGAPAGVRSHQFIPSADFSEAVCLWEADSLEQVRDHVDGALGDSARNTYFTVAEAASVGLPAATGR